MAPEEGCGGLGWCSAWNPLEGEDRQSGKTTVPWFRCKRGVEGIKRMLIAVLPRAVLRSVKWVTACLMQQLSCYSMGILQEGFARAMPMVWHPLLRGDLHNSAYPSPRSQLISGCSWPDPSACPTKDALQPLRHARNQGMHACSCPYLAPARTLQLALGPCATPATAARVCPRAAG